MVARLRAPGFYRAFLGVALGIAFSAAITWVVRASTGHATFTHYLSPDAILTVSLIACPLFFLVGFGLFDYWFHWAAGKPTRPEDHSGHGAIRALSNVLRGGTGLETRSGGRQCRSNHELRFKPGRLRGI